MIYPNLSSLGNPALSIPINLITSFPAKKFWVISLTPFEDHFQISFLVSYFADLLVLHHCLELLLIKVTDTLSSELTYLRRLALSTVTGRKKTTFSVAKQTLIYISNT